VSSCSGTCKLYFLQGVSDLDLVDVLRGAMSASQIIGAPAGGVLGP
jgi:hypothetical protein